MLDELDRQWQRLGRRSATWRTIRSWDVEGRFDHCDPSDGLDGVVSLTRPDLGGADDHEAVLRHLVSLATTDELAARIVLQRILPGIIVGARRWTTGDRSQDPIDVVIGAAWLAIRAFDVPGRHCQIAPALVADSLWIGLRRESRRARTNDVPVPSNVLAERADPAPRLDPLTALAATLRAAERAGVPAGDLDLVRHLARTGSPSVVANERGVTPRTVRNHRDVATSRIRNALGVAGTDWSDPFTAAA